MASVETEEKNQPTRRFQAWEKWVLGLLWLVMSAANAGLFLSLDRPIFGRLMAVALFAVIMAVVCALGYLRYAGQFRDDRQRSDPLLKKYLPALKTTAIQQGILVTLASLMLDLGQAFHVAIMATLAYWMMFALIVVRRQESPTRTDLHAIRWGFLYIYFAVGIAAPLWWAHVGRTY